MSLMSVTNSEDVTPWPLVKLSGQLIVGGGLFVVVVVGGGLVVGWGWGGVSVYGGVGVGGGWVR